MGMNSRPKELANDVDKYQQPSELDYIRRSHMMTLYRYHCRNAKAAQTVPFPGNPHAPNPRFGGAHATLACRDARHRPPHHCFFSINLSE